MSKSEKKHMNYYQVSNWKQTGLSAMPEHVFFSIRIIIITAIVVTVVYFLVILTRMGGNQATKTCSSGKLADVTS